MFLIISFVMLVTRNLYHWTIYYHLPFLFNYDLPHFTIFCLLFKIGSDNHKVGQREMDSIKDRQDKFKQAAEKPLWTWTVLAVRRARFTQEQPLCYIHLFLFDCSKFPQQIKDFKINVFKKKS